MIGLLGDASTQVSPYKIDRFKHGDEEPMMYIVYRGLLTIELNASRNPDYKDTPQRVVIQRQQKNSTLGHSLRTPDASISQAVTNV